MIQPPAFRFIQYPTDASISIGLYVIAASKFYMDAHPTCRLVVLEQDTCPGGSWNASENVPPIMQCYCEDA